MNHKSIEQLLRNTRRKLFFARWLTASVTFYFYAFFLGTALVLTDRIGGELDLWNPFTLEWVILTGVVVSLVAGGVYGVIHAWRNRCSRRELAWMIDRRCDMDAMLVTALDADELNVDSSWSSLIREQANQLTKSYLRKNLFRLPGQGIRWMFLVALLLDLGLVLFLTPRYEIKRKQPKPQVTNPSGSTSGNASGARGTAGTSEDKGRKTNQTSNGGKQGNKNKTNNESNQNNSSKSNPQSDSKNESRNDNPDLFGKEERHEHERNPEVVQKEAKNGPTREGLVRMLESDKTDSGKGGSSEQEDADSPNPDPSRAEALHRQYQRQAERMIWRRSLSPDEQDLVRRYFKRIRPESNERSSEADRDSGDAG